VLGARPRRPVRGRDVRQPRARAPAGVLVPVTRGRAARALLALALIAGRSEEHTSELQSRENLVCRLRLEKKKGQFIAEKPLFSGMKYVYIGKEITRDDYRNFLKFFIEFGIAAHYCIFGILNNQG